MSRIGRSTEMESRLVVNRDEEEGMESNCFMGTGFHSGVMEMFLNYTGAVVWHTMNVPNATELFPSKWLI